MRFDVWLSLLAVMFASVTMLAACKEETKKTETTVQTDPAGEPAKVEEKTTTEEKQ